MSRRLYIETVGCQMNMLDSELVAGELLQAGYELVDSQREADTILFNTCSVRQHAEDKIYSALGRLKHVKEHHPHKIVGVLGCMAQKDRQKIFRRAPHVDLVVGPGQLGRLPELLQKIAAGEGPQIELSLDRTADTNATVMASFEQYDPHRTDRMRPTPHQAMVRIVFGCDKFCTYCIVPSVRGPEQSRPVGEIEAEVRRLVDDGCLEVTLLGQTVNSYKDKSTGSTVRLADLLDRLHGIEGLRRLKFVTNYPRHMTTDLLQAVRDLPRVSPYLHIPAQSGSNRMLERMRRGYTVESYREMLAQIRETIPEAAVTSDFIVGFCGETEEDYQQTVDLVHDGQFKNSFIFKYSTRPGTKSAELYEDDVPDEVKRRRNNNLLDEQNAISLEDNRRLVGRQVEILVEGPSKAARKQAATEETSQLVGRTVCDRIVVFDGPNDLIGQIVDVRIEKADACTLF
ncbi:MAG TPA: tRNA (N6-isopentenyl adenosine(37)-C2)-methylthiotransferase MiaB, partial [Thermoguttaceae bacterium]|nr:tRNA (N6-isopentenyl adenosine(37)-C2)-methylthiotransferase MiaB [Thermoguttaceae bacterium]